MLLIPQGHLTQNKAESGKIKGFLIRLGSPFYLYIDSFLYESVIAPYHGKKLRQE
jgi:hypothetical protein